MKSIEQILLDCTKLPSLHTYPTLISKLTPNQQNTLAAAYKIISHHRAVLLYEMTGSGKTFVAIALATLYQNKHQSDCYIVAPAHLLNIWKQVAESFSLNAKLFSYQAASLHSIPPPPKEDTIWLIDEAHMLKNPATKRYQELQKLTARHMICLITATPVSLGWQDLHALMTLCGFPPLNNIDESWLQSFTHALIPQSITESLTTDDVFETTRQTIRYQITKNNCALQELINTLTQIQWFTTTYSGTLNDVQLLPHILIHRLLSHRTSCLMTLQKLERYYSACRLHSSRQMLSRHDFHLMMGIEGKQQILPFEELIYGTTLNDDDKLQLDSALNHIKKALALLKSVCRTPDEKLISLRQFIQNHPHNHIVILTQYADTAIYLSENLHIPQPTVLLTANQARYKHYPVHPDIILAMFDPNMTLPEWWKNTGQPNARILIASDAFSCGHNFQNANILIHFDLPWNPTTLHQREGRLLRKGQTNPNVLLLQMKLAQSPNEIIQYESTLCDRLLARKTLQNKWYAKTPPNAHTSQLLITEQNGIPNIWAQYANNLWIPIPHQSVPRIPPQADVFQTTLAEAFDNSTYAKRPVFSNLWKALKLLKYHSNIYSIRKSAAKSIYEMTFFPQLQNTELLKQPFTNYHYSEIARLIQTLPIKSIPSPETPCWKVILYPQNSNIFSQAMHKLSTANPPNSPPASSNIYVNTES